MQVMARTLFTAGFRTDAFVPQMGVSFSDLRDTWDKYAPTVKTDLKALRDAWASGKSATVPVTSPTNLTPAPALQKSTILGIPTTVAVVGGLGILAAGAYFLLK